MRLILILATLARSLGVLVAAGSSRPATISPLTIESRAEARAPRTLSSPSGMIRPAALTSSDPKPLPPMDRAEAELRWNKIEKWLDCLKGKCLIKEDDPRELHFTVRDGVLAEAQWFVEHSPVGEAAEKRAFDGAKQLLTFPDEQVQGLALQWITQLPRQASTPALIERSLDDMVDPELAHAAILELRRHMNTDQEEEAMAVVHKLLFEGGIFASREVARSSSLLIYDGNRERFERWLHELPKESSKHRLLQAALREGQLEI